LIGHVISSQAGKLSVIALPAEVPNPWLTAHPAFASGQLAVLVKKRPQTEDIGLLP
jgi:hypothetical protein